MVESDQWLFKYITDQHVVIAGSVCQTDLLFYSRIPAVYSGGSSRTHDINDLYNESDIMQIYAKGNNAAIVIDTMENNEFTEGAVI